MNNNFDFKKNYINWIRENVYQEKISSGIYRFTLPFLDRHNDQIEVYIEKDGKDFRITDDRYTVSDLEMSGLNIFSSAKRQKIYNQILNAHGVSETEDHKLYVTGKMSEIAMKKHLMAQCIQKIGDLFYLAHPNIKSLFLEDVQLYLDQNDIRYVSDVSFIGRSKLPTNYDFAIPKSKNAPQRIIKVVNNLTIEYTRSIIFTWSDISEARTDESQLYTFIQDFEKRIASDALTAFEEYDIKPILWSNRDKATKLLIA